MYVQAFELFLFCPSRTAAQFLKKLKQFQLIKQF